MTIEQRPDGNYQQWERREWRPIGWPNISDRAPPADREILARGLAQIAQRIDPDMPAKAAKMMIDKADGEYKQIRYFRFEHKDTDRKKPGRPRSKDLSADEPLAAHYVGYVHLARAGYAIEKSLSIPDKDDSNWRDYERQFFKGTSRVPEVKVDLDSAVSLDDIVTRYLQKIETVVRRTEIDSFWKKLRQQPFRRVEFGNADPQGLEGRPWTFTKIQTPDGEIPDWALPSFRLGEIAFPLTVKSLPIPLELASAFRPEAFEACVHYEGDDSWNLHRFCAAASRWLNRLVVNSDTFYQWGNAAQGTALPWEDLEIYGICSLYLRLCPSADGSLQYELFWKLLENYEGDHRISFPDQTSALFALRDPQYSAWKSIQMEGEEYVGLMVEKEEGNPTHLIQNWHCLRTEIFGRYTLIERSSIDEDDLDLICRMPFFATLPSKSDASLPVPPDTVIEALLCNETVVDTSARLSRQIEDRCAEIVRGGMAHYHQMNEQLDEILEGMIGEA